MTDEQTTTVVLKDDEGVYYVLTPDLLGKARLSADRAAALEKLLTEGDVRGFKLNYSSPKFAVLPLLVQLPTDFEAPTPSE
jgi:hypothetical protein